MSAARTARCIGRSKHKKISWYKAMHDLEDNPLWPAIAKRVGVSFFEVVGIVRHLWTCASRNKERGSIVNFDAEILAAQAGADQAKIEAVISALTDKGYIVGGRLVDWARTQGENVVEISMSPGAIRTRRYRARKRAAARQTEMMFVFNGSPQPIPEPQPAVAVAHERPPPERVTPASHRVTEAITPRTEGRAKRQNQDSFKKEESGSLRRCAPFNDPYERAIKASKRERWLDNLTRWSLRRFSEAQMVEVWGIIGAARDTAPLSPATKKTLNRLDTLYRLEKVAA